MTSQPPVPPSPESNGNGSWGLRHLRAAIGILGVLFGFATGFVDHSLHQEPITGWQDVAYHAVPLIFGALMISKDAVIDFVKALGNLPGSILSRFTGGGGT